MLFEPHIKWSLPSEETYPFAMFGVQRKHDVHTGIDIYVPYGTKVFPIESGKVINVEWFTGNNSVPSTPWWNETQAVWIQSGNGHVFVYGEIEATVSVGQDVTPETCIGTILHVLKVNKGKNPTTMLHLELYDSAPKETAIWTIKSEQPEGLLDPLDYLNRNVKR